MRNTRRKDRRHKDAGMISRSSSGTGSRYVHPNDIFGIKIFKDFVNSVV